MKNYTSNVPVNITIDRIESILVNRGARNIAKTYEAGRVISVDFSMPNPTGGSPLYIRLPANEEAVFKVLLSTKKRTPMARVKEKIREQAKRTAWKLMQDWIEVQMSLVEMQQAEMLQVFLPYIWTGEKSYYALAKERGFMALTHQPETESK